MAATFYTAPNISAAQIVTADSTNFKSIWTAGANGGILTSLKMQSTDTSNRDIQIAISISGVDYPIGTVQCLANLGNTNAIPSQNVLGMPNIVTSFNTDNNGNRVMQFPPNAILKAKALTAVTSTRAVTLIAEGANI